MKKYIVLLAMLIPLFFANDAYAYPGGVLQGKEGTLSDGAGTSGRATDGDTSTYVYLDGSIVWTLDRPERVVKFRIMVSHFSNVYFIDANGKTIYSKEGLNNEIVVDVEGVKQVGVYGRGSYLYEFDVWTYADTVPPAVPTGLAAVSGEQVTLTWNPNTESDLAGYNVYANGAKLNTSVITDTSYTVSGTADTSYGYRISAVDGSGNESAKTAAVFATVMGPPKSPVLASSSVTQTALRLTWDKSASSYEVYKDGSMISTTLYTFVDVTGLSPNTSYDFYVIGIDQYGRRNNSNTVTVTTLDAVPVKPKLSVTNKSHQGFTLSWAADPYATSYDVYLAGALVTQTDQTTHTFNNLTPDTVYAFKVVVRGSAGSAEAESSLRTDKAPIPEITSAKVSPVSGQPTKRNLSYQANDMVTDVKVYVDGQLIGEYPVSQSQIELDFASLADLAKIKLEPVPDGKGYEFEALADEVDGGPVDEVVSAFVGFFQVLRKAFWYIALAAIPLVIAVLIYFWMRRKWKRVVGESKEESKLLNKQATPIQEKVDAKEERRKFIPWREMTQEQKNEWRASKGLSTKMPLTDAEKDKTGLRTAERLGLFSRYAQIFSRQRHGTIEEVAKPVNNRIGVTTYRYDKNSKKVVQVKDSSSGYSTTKMKYKPPKSGGTGNLTRR